MDGKLDIGMHRRSGTSFADDVLSRQIHGLSRTLTREMLTWAVNDRNKTCIRTKGGKFALENLIPFKYMT